MDDAVNSDGANSSLEPNSVLVTPVLGPDEGSAPPVECTPEAQASEAQASEAEASLNQSETSDTLGNAELQLVAPALIPLDQVDEDDEFCVRLAGDLDDVSQLAMDIARLGQLFPVDLRFRAPDRFQVIAGFRRVKALKFLHRDKVLARLHTDLSDNDARTMALAGAIHGAAVSKEALVSTRDRWSAQGHLNASAREMLEQALSADDALAPEQVEEEVDADELAADVTLRLGQCNQDLSLLADVFEALDPTRRAELLTQLRYSAELVEYLEDAK